jgi:GNAT superfamily N-acetyltransferase
MLRTAKPNDTGRIVDLLAETHARSRYADLPFDRRFTYGLVQQAIQRNMGTNDGGCLVVVDVVDQKVEGFIIGTLSRVYLILDALSAKDLFLIASDKAGPLAARKLMGAYAEWASRNPKVYEIELTHTDVTPESARIGEIYERMGFEPFGHAYRRSNPAFAGKVKEAA